MSSYFPAGLFECFLLFVLILVNLGQGAQNLSFLNAVLLTAFENNGGETHYGVKENDPKADTAQFVQNLRLSG